MTNRKQLFWATTALMSGLLMAGAASAQSTGTEATEVSDVVVTGQRDPLKLDDQAQASSRLGLSIRETPASVEVLTQDDLQLRGLRTARERPLLPILALSPKIATARRLCLAWGIHCVLTEDATDLEGMVDKACRVAVEQGHARPGERIIVTAGVPLGTPGATNMLRIAYIGSDGLSAV